MRAALSRLLLVVSTAAVVSCGPRAGHGVLLWTPGGTTDRAGQQVVTPVPQLGPNGSVVPLVRHSKLQNVYWVRPAGQRGLVEVPVWRFRRFEAKKAAAGFAASYAPLAKVYAYSLRRGLPLRESPGQDARIVYKLDTNQVVKVTWRAERRQQAGVYTNRWYRVLTDDGYEGYCFGQYLRLFQTPSDPYEEAAALQSRDELLALVLAEVWRPEYFREMIDKRRLDLRRFREDVGLFPDPAVRQVRIQKLMAAYRFDYREVRKLTASSYQFEGSDLRVEVLGEDRLVASYPTPERLVSEVYVRIEEDVAELIEKERERRREIYKAFAGSVLSSSAYGTIEFGQDMDFAWKGYERLVPAVVPAGAGERGRIDFRYHLDAEAEQRFDGAITFRFAALPAEREITFLYKLEGAAVRLVYAAPRAGDDLLMRSSAATSWVLFFE